MVLQFQLEHQEKLFLRFLSGGQGVFVSFNHFDLL